ncbi:MAG: hypothetical protein H6834_05495 [Planctomycetes bacterium]|nr:hypothetical protein [Planctomycetota bacterium]MCB9890853.1 hypothetical protein [Planctomycetota bacterium]
MLRIFAVASALLATSFAKQLAPTDGSTGVIITRPRVGSSVEIEVLGAPDGVVRVELEVKDPNTGTRTRRGVARGVSCNGRVVLQGPILDVDYVWFGLLADGFSADGKVLGVDVNMIK